ncbi:hypothetical protein HAX54_050409 [Datura stramonium]|uniref:Uncharacterized protein n=1 Tax=Datura stramonium TaxID=4076 RepID=A0ABS8RQY2_DATST|nr:hypothetical protein [Datura stramonium]
MVRDRADRSCIDIHNDDRWAGGLGDNPKSTKSGTNCITIDCKPTDLIAAEQPSDVGVSILSANLSDEWHPMISPACHYATNGIDPATACATPSDTVWDHYSPGLRYSYIGKFTSSYQEDLGSLYQENFGSDLENNLPELMEEVHEIKTDLAYLRQYYFTLYTTDTSYSTYTDCHVPFHTIPATAHIMLEATVTAQEIWLTVKSFQPFKAPRPDDLHPFFFQKYWFNIAEGTQFGKYLGFPLSNGRNTKADFQFLVDNFKTRLAGGKTTFLTVAAWSYRQKGLVWKPARGLGGVFRNSDGIWILGFTLSITVETVLYLFWRLSDARVVHVSREQNRLADQLATLATTSERSSTTQLFWNTPPFLMDILNADTCGEPSIRRVPITNVGMHNRTTSTPYGNNVDIEISGNIAATAGNVLQLGVVETPHRPSL